MILYFVHYPIIVRIDEPTIEQGSLNYDSLPSALAQMLLAKKASLSALVELRALLLVSCSLSLSLSLSLARSWKEGPSLGSGKRLQ
jgi:hypothetical protein